MSVDNLDIPTSEEGQPSENKSMIKFPFLPKGLVLIPLAEIEKHGLLSPRQKRMREDRRRRKQQIEEDNNNGFTPVE
ncbi:MAG TPA: hypothetical protein VKF38_00400 [Anaerolineaceae bacterium]|nr:hypothetical protein [Anaerolineaceae bacterium]